MTRLSKPLKEKAARLCSARASNSYGHSFIAVAESLGSGFSAEDLAYEAWAAVEGSCFAAEYWAEAEARLRNGEWP